MMLAWNALLGVALLMWIVLRVLYRRALAKWRSNARANIVAEANDAWGLTRRGEWSTQRDWHEIQREGYETVQCITFSDSGRIFHLNGPT
jgi:hypothetical protein